MPYLPHTPEDVAEMLRSIGAESMEDLFRSIPEEFRLRRPLRLPPRKTEAELLAAFRELESKNLLRGSRPCFLGAGSYLRFIPAAVDYLAGRGEFWTAYTPYQPEASQGTLQATFEYQSLMARLTAMEISNASMYEAGTALAEAIFMAYGVHGRGERVLASEGVHPEYLRVLETYLARHPARVERIQLRGWTTDPDALSACLERGEDVFAVVVQNPNFFGAIENVGLLSQRAKKSESAPLFVSVVEPVSLAVLAPPGDCGADIAVGDGQPLGNYPAYGGSTFGFFATKEAYVRRIPGRIVGETKDRDGKIGYVLTFQTREQHIRRERATSNICTNQALCALRAAIYLSLLGEEGLREVAEASARKARYAYKLLRSVLGVEPAEGADFFFEFPIRLPIPAEEAYDRLAEKGITGGLPMSRLLRGRDREMLLAFTELTRREDIDRLAEALEDILSGARTGESPERLSRPRIPVPSGMPLAASPPPDAEAGRKPTAPESESTKALRDLPTMFDRSRPGRRGVLPPPAEPELPPLDDLPGWALRSRPAGLPCLSELDVVRHYTLLSGRNFAIDKNFYPLGSCTMKYNPRVHEVVAALPGFALAHPLSKPGEVQGLLQAFRALEEILAEVSGLPHVSLQPAAGAHGELTALLAIRAYHEDQASGGRKIVLVPDSAHGTNPSSCTIAGFEVREVRSGPDGRLDLEDLRSKIDDSVAAMMLTNPNTLGIFEARIREAADMLHAAGALLYMDGANMNALLGIARPGDFGVDIMHCNLHKTFSTPHGGGGPGAGPVAASDELEPYLPVPRIAKNPDGSLELREDRPRSIGKVRSFFGSSGVLLRALAYLWAHGPEDLRRVSECAVLNAAYLRSRLEPAYHLPYSTPTLHEVVFSAKNQKAFGVRALDIAKRLIDLGFHPPTIYFPLIVPEALMIEPTETESKETLDAFATAMLRIAKEAETAPEILLRAPETTPVKRLDEVTAVKRPVLVCPCS